MSLKILRKKTKKLKIDPGESPSPNLLYSLAKIIGFLTFFWLRTSIEIFFPSPSTDRNVSRLYQFFLDQFYFIQFSIKFCIDKPYSFKCSTQCLSSQSLMDIIKSKTFDPIQFPILFSKFINIKSYVTIYKKK